MIKSISFVKVEESDLDEYPIYDRKNPEVTEVTKHPDYSLAVLPENCRPSFSDAKGTTWNDPLTNGYNIPEPEKTIQTLLRQRWGGGGIGRKKGNFHKYLNGKRQNNCFRGVLISNLDLPLGCVGLPNELKLVKLDYTRENPRLHYPIKVCIYEAKYKIKITRIFNSEKQTFIKAMPNSSLNGINVEFQRLLKDDDLVIINRQPTLRCSNLVSMRVKLFPNTKVIQLHPAILSLFDADLDGDEVNGNIPGTKLDPEMEKIRVEYLLINPVDDSLAAGVVQDAMYGYFLDYPESTKNKLHSQLALIDSPTRLASELFNIFKNGCHRSYMHGVSADFSCATIDTMIDCGAKGKIQHKERFREFIHGIYDDDKYKSLVKTSRDSMISKTLRTGESGQINRQLAYLMDDLRADGHLVYDLEEFVVSFDVSSLPPKLRTNPRIGLFCVTAIIPELTQSVLDLSLIHI